MRVISTLVSGVSHAEEVRSTGQCFAPARALANTLRERVHGGAFNGGDAMTLSVGVAELREDMDVSTFVGAAFDAMAAARRSGGNRTVLSGKDGIN